MKARYPGAAVLSRVATCERCGIQRTKGGNSSPLCTDCRAVLTREERQLWAA